MDRRGFLQRAMYYTVASVGMTVAGCGGGDGGGSGNGSRPQGSFSFPLGVASGDPKDSSVVFWTRCISVAADSVPVSLRLYVSTSATFDTTVAFVDLTAAGTYDFTVRAKVNGLAPDTRYYYRFVAGNDFSVAGQTKTAPASSAPNDAVRFAWLTCQDWDANHWAAMDLLAAENVDFLVHLGDYIYETVAATFRAGQAEPVHSRITLPNGLPLPAGGIYANSLEDYRTLYRTYRGDGRLQELHRKFPMVAIWDDHEFSDDCWQDHQTYTNQNRQETSRRRNATQAWAEYMPIDFGDVSFDLGKTGYDNIRIYRDFKFGSLLHLVMTDERLYRDDHVVSEASYARLVNHDPVAGDDAIGSRYFVPQNILAGFEAQDTAALGRPPSILGATQSQWWKDTLKGSNSTWKVWGNEVPLNRMWLDMRNAVPPPYNQLYVVDADSWDGYPAHKAELLGFLKTQGIQNVVAITGDLHAFQCGVLRDLQDPVAGSPVAVDFVAAGISSTSFYKSLKAASAGTPLAALVATPESFDYVMRTNNPDLAYVDHDAQGYAVATVTASAFTVLFNKVKPLNADGTKPAIPLLKRTRITVPAGAHTPVIEDNVA